VSTYAHVTVTVVHDGVTTTYDIPQVDKFETGVEYEPPGQHDTLTYGPLESSAPSHIKALTFSMRPWPESDDKSMLTVTIAPGTALGGRLKFGSVVTSLR